MDKYQWVDSRELGTRLVSVRQRIDRAEADWLAMVAEFDHRGAWSADGALSMVDWLMVHCGLGRSAAKERVRVAHEIKRRPLIRERFAAGTLSFSKVRAITRITDADESVDRALLTVADHGTTADLEAAVAHWRKLRDQDDPGAADEKTWEKRGLRRYRQHNGLDTIEIVAPPEDIERIMCAVDAYLSSRHQPVDKVSAETLSTGQDPVPWHHRRVDALTDLLEEGLVHAADQGAIDPERAQVYVGVDYQTLVERAPGHALLGAGQPLTGDAARRLACDAGLVRIITRGRSEILDVGRKTREWPTAVRRAILFRHHNQCAVPGCGRRVVQIHHIHHWTKGGHTAVHLGVPLCTGHHRLVHDQHWTVDYDTTTGITTLTAPDGRTITTTALPLEAA